MPTRSRINSTAIGRRPFLAGLAATTAAASTAAIAKSGVVGSGLRLLETPAPGPVDVHMATQALSDAAAVLVDDAALATRGLVEALHPNRGLVKELRHDREFSMFALTWRDAPNVTAFFRAERPDGSWSEWFSADSVGAPGITGEGIQGTDPVYIGRTKAVQVSSFGLNVFGEKPEDIIDVVKRAGAGDFAGLADLLGPVALHDVKGVFIDGGLTPDGVEPVANDSDVTGMPRVITRAGWGADESIRGSGPTYDDKLEAATVHHTAGANNYSQAEAAGIVRGIYKYHTQVLGWGDVGYNALVDKFGNIYEGRYGGLTKNVQGAHAGGFNKGTFGISMMGDYSTAHPTQAMINSVGAMIGWRLRIAGLDPSGKATLVSQGYKSAKYGAGQKANLPTIFAHRDVGDTTCPGNAGYAQMDRIRAIAAQKSTGLGDGIINNEHPDGTTDIRADLPGSSADIGEIIDGLGLPPEAIAAIPGLQAMGDDKNGAGKNGDGKKADDKQADTFSGGRSILAASLGLAGAPGLGNDAESVLGAVGRNADQGPSLADIPVVVQPTTAKDGDDEFAAEWRKVTDEYGDVLGKPVTGVQQGATVPNDSGTADPVRYVKFERGIIVNSIATGTHAIWEEVAEAWAKQGFEIGRLGAPTTTQAPNWGADRADFQGGSITRDGVTRAVNVAYA
ncbi:N-acetylmuramoyl-L-alanine amidase [Corynebacterium hansenii]|uniref:N-acetylmuramoyl-L-alanine amidase n=1 Tax=Corynebacterium hansenii TaxID=394964 RepID=A0ABV7ZU38_9CORY|nr:N-acetylmuramoyl-L-alanine amidase [Corynebacterium hansenii]WJZ01230.1 N-acetylmuramoyl-L-alanine amidase [Corynebacterium hansenii]